MIGGTEILKKLSRAVEINDAWQRGYAAQIQAVARQFIEDDCTESSGESLTPDHYAQLQQYIDDKNEALQTLSRYVSNKELFALWRRIEPSRDLTANSRDLLKILIKLEVAHVLLERLNSGEDDANLDEAQKAAFKASLEARRQNLNNRAIAIPADPDPESETNVREQPDTWPRALLLSLSRIFRVMIQIIYEMSSRERAILRHSPMLWRADISLRDFVRNLFWVSFHLWKILCLTPIHVVLLLPFDVGLFFLSEIGFLFGRQRPRFLQGHMGWYEKCIMLISLCFSIGIGCVSFAYGTHAWVGLIAGVSPFAVGAIGSMEMIATLLGLTIMMAPIMAFIATLGFIVGVGGYRCIIKPIVDRFTPTPKITKAEVIAAILYENNEEFHERFEIQPELRAVVYSLHIPLEYQVMLSNQDLEDLKLTMAERRLSEPDLQEELVLAHERFKHLTPTFETFRVRFRSAVANLAFIDEQPFRPRLS